LLNALAAGDSPASETAAGVCRDLAGTGVRGAARAQFRALRAGARSGTLSGRAGEETGSAGGIESTAAVAGTRALAREFRPALAELARTTRQTRGHAGDDRVTHTRQALRMGSTTASGRAIVGLGLHGCGRGAALADGNGTESSARRVPRTEWTGTLRATAAPDERVRPVTRHRCQHGGGGEMKEQTQALEHASVKQYCKALRVPMIGAHFVQLAEQAIKEQRSHSGYLEALLTMEAEERDRHAIQQRLRDAKLPRVKTLEEFDFNQARQIPAAKIRELAEGGYIERAEPVVLMGECSTGKTHLATGLCVAACRQKRRARFTTAANLVNELVEARQHNAVKRVLARWLRYDVIVLDEVGYVPLADIGAEFLFQVIAERAERATLIVTTNLPFSEWTQVFPNLRLCKALLDRITDRAHIIETGAESYRFRRTLEVRQKKKAS